MDNPELIPPHNTPTTQYPNSHKTFAETTANTHFPKREQAIIFNTINDVPQIEYIKAFSLLTSPNNIKFASRISNNRFCIYFAHKNIVEQIFAKQSFIVINNIEIFFRRLVNPAKRIIISNVQPIIPHNVIEKALINLEIKLLSSITFMKAGFAYNEFEHIGSFRRQLYIHPDDSSKLPGSILINFDETDYRLFLSDDTVICYLCKQTGHTSNHCKKEIEKENFHMDLQNSNTTTPNSPNRLIMTEQDVYSNKVNTVNSIEINHSQETPVTTCLAESTYNLSEQLSAIPNNQTIIPDTIKTQQSNNIYNLLNINNRKTDNINLHKRPASSSATSSNPPSPIVKNTNNTNNQTGQENITISHTQKKLKKSTSIDNFLANIETNLEPCRKLFTSNQDLPIDFDQFKYLIETAQNPSDLQDELLSFSIDAGGIIGKIINQAHNLVNDRSLKIRLSKLHKKLINLAKEKKETYSNNKE